MSILIKGMKMPKNCYDCTMESICSRWALHDAEWQKENRDKDCPLVPVPPHGRLIDADARVDVQLYNDEFEDYQTVNMSIDDLLDSSWIELEDDPTIIPAEEGKRDRH